MNKKIIELKYIFLFFGVFLLDFITKTFINIKKFSTSTGIIDITYTTNSGSFFGLFSSVSFINLFFIIASIAALGLLIYIWRTEECYYVPLTLIFSGVFANLFDRIFYGHVIDWINFHIWPVFNIADSAIVLGILYFVYILIMEMKNDIKCK